MCGAKAPPAMPPPQAPPAPPTELDNKQGGLAKRQRAASLAQQSGYEANLLSGPGGVQGAAPTASPVLGG